MKISLKYLFVIILALSFSTINAQVTVIYGYVKSLNNNIGIANHQVLIQSQIDTTNSTGMNYYSTVFTSNNGFFLDSVSIPQGQNVKFKVSTLDCQSKNVVDSFYTMNPQTISLLICDTGLLSCKSDYLTYPDTGNYKKIFFVNMSTPSNGQYKWYFGDGDSSHLKNPVHTYIANGQYAVSLRIYDPTTGCFDTKTDSISVGPGFHCYNAFTYNLNYLTATFQGTINNNLPTIFNWNFGDMLTATGQNPTHIYNHAGIYKVSLQTISINPQNFDTCISNVSKYISIQSPPTGNIWGQLFADSLKLKSAEVLLYRFKNPKIGYELIDSTLVTHIDSSNLSFYYFSDLQYGDYLTKARILKDPINSSRFGPAYYGNTFHWELADSFHLNEAGVNKPIHLTKIFKPSGSVRIEGKVLEGNLKNPGDPISGIIIFLYDVQGDVYGYTYSDKDGDFSFDNLDQKKYFIHAEIINKKIIPSWVWPDDNDLVITGVNIYVGKEQVTSINETQGFDLKIFPNPASEQLTIQFDALKMEEFTISIYNVLGIKIKEEIFQAFPGENLIYTNVSNLSKGIYLVSLKTDEKKSKPIQFIIN